MGDLIDLPEVWCVRHRSGWCAAKENRRLRDMADSVPTLCGHVVVLPYGYDERDPTCDECYAIIQERHRRARGIA